MITSRRAALTAFVGSVFGSHLPMVGRGGVLLPNSGPNVPALVRAPSSFNFGMATGPKKGWPGSNNQFEHFGTDRDWAANFSDPGEGFSGIRWQPTWVDVRGYHGLWEPAGGDVFRVRRKGTRGRDARTLVFEGGPNPAAVPVGDKVVFWAMDSDGGANGDTALDLSGWKLQLKTKYTVTASRGSAMGDANGRRIIEIDAGTTLPAIDHRPGGVQGPWYERRTLQHRHWSFYKNSATRELRHPLGWFVDLSLNSVLKNGGYLMLGGLQWTPTWWDWSREWSALGASLVEELWRLECEGLADHCGNADPNRLAVELENEPTQDYRLPGGAGYGDLLASVWYPVARRAWGRDRTLVVKSTSFGALNSLLGEFDFACPTGDNAHLVFHNYARQIRGPGGVYSFEDIGQTDWIADQCRAKINALGYRGGGSTELGVAADHVPEDRDRGQRLGRLLTSLTRRDLYMFVWSMVGDNVRCSDVRNVNGRRIEAYWPGISPYARRAGIMTR